MGQLSIFDFEGVDNENREFRREDSSDVRSARGVGVGGTEGAGSGGASEVMVDAGSSGADVDGSTVVAESFGGVATGGGEAFDERLSGDGVREGFGGSDGDLSAAQGEYDGRGGVGSGFRGDTSVEIVSDDRVSDTRFELSEGEHTRGGVEPQPVDGLVEEGVGLGQATGRSVDVSDGAGVSGGLVGGDLRGLRVFRGGDAGGDLSGSSDNSSRDVGASSRRGGSSPVDDNVVPGGTSPVDDDDFALGLGQSPRQFVTVESDSRSITGVSGEVQHGGVDETVTPETGSLDAGVGPRGLRGDVGSGVVVDAGLAAASVVVCEVVDGRRVVRSAKEAETLTGVVTDRSFYGPPSGQIGRVEANLAALRVVKDARKALVDAGCRADVKVLFSVADRQTMARWSGWGALPQVFDEDHFLHERFKDDLGELLSDEELEAARASTLNAHYTDPAIGKYLWSTVERLGGSGAGRWLEPGCGNGAFMSCAPDDVTVVGVEREPVSADLAAFLHPNHDVHAVRLENFNAKNLAGAVGNVPFGAYSVFDSTLRTKNSLRIHNYCIAKSLESVAPGGIVAVITSRYTLDSGKVDQRSEIARRGVFVGAVRLPSGAHNRYAGTSVVTDILVFVRRPEILSKLPKSSDLEAMGERDWLTTVEVTDFAVPVTMNQWLYDRKDSHVVGELSVGHGMYGPGDLIVELDEDTALDGLLSSAITKLVVDGRSVVDQVRSECAAIPVSSKVDVWEPPQQWKPPEWVREGTILSTEKGFVVCTDGGWNQYKPSSKSAGRVLKAACDLRVATRNLMDGYIAEASNIADLQWQLSVRYDALLKAAKWSSINEGWKKSGSKKTRLGGFGSDSDIRLLLGLEECDETGVWRKAAIFTESTVRPEPVAKLVSTLQDAVIQSMARFGKVDEKFIRSVYLNNFNMSDLAEQGLAFLEPSEDDSGELDGRWVAAPLFLSGNVRQKLVAAKAAAATDARYAASVTALAEVVPDDIPPGQMEVMCGNTFMTPEEVVDFITWVYEEQCTRVGAVYSPEFGWEVKATGWGSAYYSFGTDKKDPDQIMEIAWTGKDYKVTKKISVFVDGIEKEKSVVDPVATRQVRDQVARLNGCLASWMWDIDPSRAEKFARRWNDQFNSFVAANFPPEWVDPPGLAKGRELYDHQKSAAAAIIVQGDMMLAHAVGAGKTATMATAAMEMRRLGLVAKPCAVVPNHLVGQWAQEVLRWYPQAKVLTPTDKKSSTVSDREEFVARCALGDWDMVIMPMSFFDSCLDTDPVWQKEYLSAQISKFKTEIIIYRDKQGWDAQKTVKAFEKTIEQYETHLKRALNMDGDQMLLFDDLGIDFIFVDEAHMYKNMTIKSANRELNKIGCAKALKFDMKLKKLRADNPGKAVTVLATGTPVANSLLELPTMMQYVSPTLLTDVGINSYDDFVNTFCRRGTRTEVCPVGGWKEKDRITHLTNLPILKNLLATRFDVRTANDVGLQIPEIVGGKPEIVTLDTYPALQVYFQELQNRVENLQYPPEPGEDTMLKIVNLARHSGLGMAAVSKPYDSNGKLPVAAERIAEIYHNTKDNEYMLPEGGTSSGSLQLVFSDLGIHPREDDPAKYCAMADLVERIIAAGVPEDKVFFLQDKMGDAERDELFEQCRRGEMAVLIGSTERMGTGMNVQDRCVHLHHISEPWKPCDTEQRNGRILRPGNQNSAVGITHWVQRGSGDLWMYETLERKAEFIASFMHASSKEWVLEDLSDDNKNAASIDEFRQMKAAAFESPLERRKVELVAELATLQVAKAAHTKQQQRQRKMLDYWKTQPPLLRDLVDKLSVEPSSNEPLWKPIDWDENLEAMFGFSSEGREEQVYSSAVVYPAVPPYKTWDFPLFLQQLVTSNVSTENGIPFGTYAGHTVTWHGMQHGLSQTKSGESTYLITIGPAAAKLQTYFSHPRAIYTNLQPHRFTAVEGRLKKLVTEKVAAKIIEIGETADQMDNNYAKGQDYITAFKDEERLNEVTAEIEEIDYQLAGGKPEELDTTQPGEPPQPQITHQTCAVDIAPTGDIIVGPVKTFYAGKQAAITAQTISSHKPAPVLDQPEPETSLNVAASEYSKPRNMVFRISDTDNSIDSNLSQDTDLADPPSPDSSSEPDIGF